MPKLALCLVCCDEEAVVGRMLDSVLPHVDSYFVSYNGARDATPRIVREKLGHLPGQVVERPWVSYGHNRTEVLRLASEAAVADYLLVVDADEVLESFGDPAALGQYDAYEVSERMAAMTQPKVRVVRAGPGWEYVGAVHEHIDRAGGFTRGSFPAVVANLRDGAGSQKDPAVRYGEEAEMLRLQLEAEPGSGRAWFYYAQSLELAGRVDDAIAAYERRVQVGGWEEETFMAVLRVAQARARRPADAPLVPGAYLRAWQLRPSRAEPLVELAEWHRNRGEHHLALLMADRAAQIPMTSDRLFVLRPYYEWRALDEKAVALHYTGRSREALLLSLSELRARAPAGWCMDHVRQNEKYYAQAAGIEL